MFLLVFVVLLGTVATVNSGQPEVLLSITGSGNDKILICRATGFNTSDIILNFKKNRCVLTEEDGVKTTGVKPQGNTYWRRDSVIIPQSEVSYFSCEVIDASSRFRVEKVWDPESDGGGRIISSKFIDTTPPQVFVLATNSSVQTNIMLTCQASGFYPNNIILIMKRNGRILTREDGVESSDICSNKDNTFKRRDSVEIKKSDMSDFSCEVIHDASGSRVEKVWDHHLPPPDPIGAGHIIYGAVMVAVGLVLGVALTLSVVLLVRRRRRILGTFARRRTFRYSGGAPAAAPPSERLNYCSDSGVPDSGWSLSGDCGLAGSGSGSSISATVPVSCSVDSGNVY